MRNVAISPGGVLSCGRPCGIVQALLGEDHVGCLGVLSCAGGMLRGSNFGQCAPQVHGGGALACLGLPRNSVLEGPIHLEHCGPIPVALKLPLVAGRQAMASQT
jgi:hypothetical protein